MTIIKKFEPAERKSKLPKKVIGLIIFSLFLLTVVEIWANNTLITYGEKYENLSRLSKSLQMGNQMLENEIAKSSSLQSIASKSASLGFSRSDSIQYIR